MSSSSSLDCTTVKISLLSLHTNKQHPVSIQVSTTTCAPGGTTASSTRSEGKTARRAAYGSVSKPGWTWEVSSRNPHYGLRRRHVSRIVTFESASLCSQGIVDTEKKKSRSGCSHGRPGDAESQDVCVCAWMRALHPQKVSIHSAPRDASRRRSRTSYSIVNLDLEVSVYSAIFNVNVVSANLLKFVMCGVDIEWLEGSGWSEGGKKMSRHRCCSFTVIVCWMLFRWESRLLNAFKREKKKPFYHCKLKCYSLCKCCFGSFLRAHNRDGFNRKLSSNSWSGGNQLRPF